METRNIIAAISLSAAVIILYSLFFAPPPVTKENLTEKTKTEQNSDAPSLDQKENVTEISREEALQQSERIQYHINIWQPPPKQYPIILEFCMKKCSMQK